MRWSSDWGWIPRFPGMMSTKTVPTSLWANVS